MRICMLWALMALNGWGQALGTWKMLSSTSQPGGSALAQTIAVKYEALSKEVHPGTETWTFYQVRADGMAETISQTLRFDGKEYPCGDLGLEEVPDTVVSTRLDARTTQVSYKRSGKVTRQVVRTVSADGRRMTLEVRIAPDKGPAATRVTVFAK